MNTVMNTKISQLIVFAIMFHIAANNAKMRIKNIIIVFMRIRISKWKKVLLRVLQMKKDSLLILIIEPNRFVKIVDRSKCSYFIAYVKRLLIVAGNV